MGKHTVYGEQGTKGADCRAEPTMSDSGAPAGMICLELIESGTR